MSHLFFDLDHTIWDFEANADETLRELYQHHNLYNKTGTTADEFISIYIKVNEALWSLYRKHEITKADLRWKRFTDSFAQIEGGLDHMPKDIEQEYINVCPTKTQLMPGAIETLNYLEKQYDLHLITNGFAESQMKKLHHSDLGKYFDTITISEEVGVQKPHPKIFQAALEKARINEPSSVYIGDNFEADAKGGVNAGWKVFWFNPKGTVVNDPVTGHENFNEINSLDSLLEHY
jgi:putative hydrolase of the HAD superfamily